MAGISAVERETGLSKDTLRIWERRYGFPLPLRDSNGERVYPPDQVEKLRLLRLLMDRGLRPGKIVGASMEELTARLGEESAPALPEGDDTDQLRAILQLLKVNEVAALRQQLSLMLMRLGLQRFVIEVVAPLNAMVGDAWAHGHIAIFEEHLYTEQMQHLLRQAIGSYSAAAERPCVLLTTLPGEQHQLGLLMAQACLTVEGARCISLGVQTPAWDIVRAAGVHAADIVALSFSAATQLHAAQMQLADLRQRLDPAVELWAGGSVWQRMRRGLQGVVTIAALTAIPSALQDWRAAHPHAG